MTVSAAMAAICAPPKWRAPVMAIHRHGGTAMANSKMGMTKPHGRHVALVPIGLLSSNRLNINFNSIEFMMLSNLYLELD